VKENILEDKMKKISNADNTNNIWKVIVIAFVMLMAVTAIVKAEENETGDSVDKAINTEALSVRLDNLQCKVDFSKTQVELVDKYLDKDLNEYLDEVTADLNDLKDLRDTGNKSAFDTYVENVFRPDFQNLTQQLNSVKSQWKSYNLSNESYTAFKKGLKDAQSQYANCTSDKEDKMTIVLEKHYTHAENKWQDMTDKMDKKNISTENMTVVIEELQARLEKLQDAIKSGNKTLIEQTLKEIRDEHLHLWARFHAARLEGYMKKMEPLTNKYGKSEQMKTMKKQLEDVSKYVSPGKKYDKGDFDKVWEGLSNTSKDMRDTAKEMLKQQNEDRKNLRDMQGQRLRDRAGNNNRGNQE
jgi:hypothetical protein